LVCRGLLLLPTRTPPSHASHPPFPLPPQTQLIELDSLPPLCVESPTAEAERAFAREVLEHAVLLSVRMGDKGSFQRHLSSLRPYYTNSAAAAVSESQNTILGLNLLYLLVENRLSDFHCELELLSEQQQAHPAITFCTKLDRHLMVGSYDQVMAAAAQPPVEYYSFFLTSLLKTVRINIGECAAASYTTLTVDAATKMLMFASGQETLSFVAENYPDWAVSGSVISLRAAPTQRSDEIPSLKLISQNLTYATELDRIV